MTLVRINDTCKNQWHILFPKKSLSWFYEINMIHLLNAFKFLQRFLLRTTLVYYKHFDDPRVKPKLIPFYFAVIVFLMHFGFTWGSLLYSYWQICFRLQESDQLLWTSTCEWTLSNLRTFGGHQRSTTEAGSTQWRDTARPLLWGIHGERRVLHGEHGGGRAVESVHETGRVPLPVLGGPSTSLQPDQWIHSDWLPVHPVYVWHPIFTH